MVRVGINGYGRIGRSFHRALLGAGPGAGVELTAVNDPFGDSQTMAFLLKHDSVGGMLANDVRVSDGGFAVDGSEIKLLQERDPSAIPWADEGVDVVIESTGLFTSREGAAGHLAGGAKKVVISAPSGDADVTLCMGVNHDAYDAAQHDVISNASCTTNCLAPLAKVLHDNFGIEQGYVTTVHAYTSDQSLQDMAKATRSGKPDVRRMRAAALSIIPSSTGAAKAIGLVLPDLKGRLDGIAMRVPVPDGSITDLVALLGREVSIDEVNEAFQKAAADAASLGVLEYTDQELVSQDIIGSPRSCVFSAPDTMANGRMVKVLGWYDNEFGYSNRLVDLAGFLGERL
jgi:glyceraldehyde 3-phosphate dehydrogenase